MPTLPEAYTLIEHLLSAKYSSDFLVLRLLDPTEPCGTISVLCIKQKGVQLINPCFFSWYKEEILTNIAEMHSKTDSMLEC